MFLDFLLFLRAGGMKVSLNEWLTLIDGLDRGLHGQTLRGFFILSRALLVKKETDMERFERLFDEYFSNITPQHPADELEQKARDPEAAARALEGYLTVEEENTGEQPLRDEARIVNSSLSKNAGAGPGSGTKIQGAGGRSIVHARGDRRFRDWRTDCAIESRQFQMAFRLLRELSRKLETSEEELDIRGTIDHTCRRGGILVIRMQPPRKNRLKLMVLIDSGGSMKPYEQICSLLFQSLHKANTFSDLKIYYFHNCLEERVYEDPSIDPERAVRTDWVLRNISGEYKVIFVGDGEMSLYELVDSSYSGGGGSDADGRTWFRRFREKYEHSIWLHPQEREENIAWMSESFAEIEKIFPMYRLSIDGLKEGMYRLLRGR